MNARDPDLASENYNDINPNLINFFLIEGRSVALIDNTKKV